MELSLHFIASKLAFSYKVEVLNDDNVTKFATVRLYGNALSVSTKYEPIIIIPARFGPEHVLDTFNGIVWLGKDRPLCKQPTIWVKEPVNELLMLDRIQNIFDMHSKWCDNVRAMLLEQRTFAEVVPLLSQVTVNPYYYADAGFRTLAIKDDDTLYASSSSWRMQSEIGRHPVEILSKFITSGELGIVNARHNAWLFDSTTFHTPFVSRTVFCQGDVFGHLFIVETYPDQETVDIEVLEMFGDLLEKHLNLSSLSHSSTGRPFEPLLRDHLGGTLSRNPAETDYLLKLLSWRPDDRYYVVVLERQDGAESALGQSMKTEVQAIEDNMPNCKAFEHEGKIACVINASLPEAVSEKMIVARLSERFRWRSAVSSLGLSFDAVPLLHKRALATLDMGRIMNPGESVYLYEDYRLAIVFAALVENTDADFLMHDDLRTLIDYDRKNDAELVRTLEVYLDNDRNASRTAEELFLHRNSVAYRLAKIDSLMMSDLDDPENRLFLTLAIRIWSNTERVRRRIDASGQ